MSQYCDRNDQSAADSKFVRESMGHLQHLSRGPQCTSLLDETRHACDKRIEGVQSNCVDVDDGEIVCISLGFTVVSRTRARKPEGLACCRRTWDRMRTHARSADTCGAEALGVGESSDKGVSRFVGTHAAVCGKLECQYCLRCGQAECDGERAGGKPLASWVDICFSEGDKEPSGPRGFFFNSVKSLSEMALAAFLMVPLGETWKGQLEDEK